MRRKILRLFTAATLIIFFSDSRDDIASAVPRERFQQPKMPPRGTCAVAACAAADAAWQAGDDETRHFCEHAAR